MLKRRRDEQGSTGAPAWMTTFSDLMTLLLVFFVLLYAYSEIDVAKFRAIANSFKGVLDYQTSAIPMNDPIQNNKNTKSDDLSEDNDKKKDKDQDKSAQVVDKNNNGKELDELLIKIKTYLKDNNLEGIITVTREKRGVVLVLQENVLFDSGHAIIKNDAFPFLDKVAQLINTLPNTIEVEGHTDSNRIIQPSPYPSNWNLSGARAANVVNYFVDKYHLVPGRFKISGYAFTQPIASNNTVEGRQKNRRVVIVILDESIDSQTQVQENKNTY